MIQYQVVEADDPEKLRTMIEAALSERWQLQGGICAIYCLDDHLRYAQALFRIREAHASPSREPFRLDT